MPNYKAWVAGFAEPVQMSPEATRGQLVFLGDGQCVTCHTVGTSDTVNPETGEGVQHARMQTYIEYTKWLAKRADERLEDVRTGNEPPTAFAAPNLTDLELPQDVGRWSGRFEPREPAGLDSKPGTASSLEIACQSWLRFTRPVSTIGRDLTEAQLGDLAQYLLAQGTPNRRRHLPS